MRHHAATALMAAAAWLPAGWADAGNAEIVADLQQQIKRCWVLPADAATWTRPVTLIFKLNRDGSLDGLPLVEREEEFVGRGAVFAMSATRAVKACQPYRLPVKDYEIWKDVKLTFSAPGG